MSKQSNNVTHSIHTLAEVVDYGETDRFDCPACGKDDKSLSITRRMDGLLLFQCFHASCDVKGGIPIIGLPPPDKTVRPNSRKEWDGTTDPIPEPTLTWINKEWGLEHPDHWYYTTDFGGRIAMSVRSFGDLHRGWVLRSDGVEPKALTYLDEGQIALSWYCDFAALPTVIVEDIPSALRAASYVNSVALLGTACGEDKAHEIARCAPRPIYIALDQDATDKAIEYAQKYSLLWDGPRILPLQKDLKNMTEAEVSWRLQKLKNKIEEN